MLLAQSLAGMTNCDVASRRRECVIGADENSLHKIPAGDRKTFFPKSAYHLIQRDLALVERDSRLADTGDNRHVQYPV